MKHERATAQLGQVVHGKPGVCRAEIRQHALAYHQVKGSLGLVVQHRALLPTKALAQVGAVLHAVKAGLGKVTRYEWAPQAYATAHV